jgi:hypothetical protein
MLLETLKRREIHSNRKIIRLSEVLSIMELNKSSNQQEISNYTSKSMNFYSFGTNSLTNVTTNSNFQTKIHINNKVTSPTANATNSSTVNQNYFEHLTTITKTIVEDSVNNSTTEFFSNFNETNLSLFQNQQQVIPDTNPEYNILDKYSKVNVYSE